MKNINIENNQFEKQKNAKAFGYTVLICALLFLFFFLNHLSLPAMPVPIVDEGIEVNLGNSETGSGGVQPEATGEPTSEQANTTPTRSVAQESLDNNGEEIINTPVKTPETKTNITPKTIVTPKVVTTPKPPTPKAVFGPQKTHSNGNNSSVDNGFKNQGNDGGKGDKGNPNGNPKSDSYKGNASSGNGLSIKSGLNGRNVAIKPNFTDEFTENAKVCVDVNVDANGKVINAIINPRGTTTTNSNIRKIAVKKAFEIKFNNGKDEDFGTIVFDFKVTN